MTEQVTVICTSLRVKVMFDDQDRLIHANGSSGKTPCGHQMFTVRREYKTNRDTAWLEVLKAKSEGRLVAE